MRFPSFFVCLKAALIVASIAVGGTPRPAQAWEADFHYGLVKWLALKAGFTDLGAERIAEASESYDESMVTDAVGMSVISLCRKRETAYQIQKLHFPAGADLPSDPADRPVPNGHYPSENSANAQVWEKIKHFGDSAKPGYKLWDFGQSLHPLADSWSHGGISDTNWFCPDDLIWSHPAARGGWRQHDADLTAKYPQDAVAAAKAIYDFLKEFRAAFERHFEAAEADRFVDRRRSPRDWEADLRDRVQTFADLKFAVRVYTSGMAKLDWFKQEGVWETLVSYRCFLRRTTLLQSEYAPCVGTSPPSAPVSDHYTEYPKAPGVEVQGAVPEDAVAFARGFLTSWIVGAAPRSRLAALGDRIDEKRLTERLAGNNEEFKKFIGDDGWVRSLFGMWFAQSHAEINDMGHGTPTHPRFSALAGLDFKMMERSFAELPDAILSLYGKEAFTISPGGSTGSGTEQASYDVSFRFRHLPNDALILSFSGSNGRYQVDGISWFVH